MNGHAHSGSAQAIAIRRAAIALAVLAPLAFAVLAVALGKEAGWDLQNYHWYNPFALLHGRLGFDIAVAHHATYYNPLTDLPFYLIATHAPAWVAGAYLGALFGIVIALIGAIAWQAMPLRDGQQRLSLSAALALAAALGGGALPSLGNTSNDVATAIGVFAALLLLVRQQQVPSRVAGVGVWMAAGLCVGAAVGLKPTNLIYALGLYAAAVVSEPDWRRRATSLASLCLGVAVGFALLGGYWALRLWQYGGNPVLPYFNDLFRSPLLVAGSFRDPSFRPQDALTAWLFPFYFAADSRLVSEWSFRDAHIAALYVLLPLTAVVILLRPSPTFRPVAPRVAKLLFVFAMVSYVAWLLLFSVYRYLVPLEMLAPVLIAAAFLMWPLRMNQRFAATAVVLIALQLVVRADTTRLSWDRDYVQVQAPQISDPLHTLILIAGTAPVAYVIPAFPTQIPFLRIDGWTVSSADRDSGLAVEMRARVAMHTGALFLLFAEYDSKRASMAARDYGLIFKADTCREVRSNIAEPLRLCALQRG